MAPTAYKISKMAITKSLIQILSLIVVVGTLLYHILQALTDRATFLFKTLASKKEGDLLPFTFIKVVLLGISCNVLKSAVFMATERKLKWALQSQLIQSQL